jgi:hypothetical protein
VRLRGVALWRWKAACRLYRIGCTVGGNHRWPDQLGLEFDEVWREHYCPHCGWMP